MSSIYQLTTISTLAPNTLFAVYDNGNGDTRKVSLQAVSDYIAANITANISGYTTQYSSPSVTGFSVNVTDSGVSIHLILTPTGTMAAGTIVLPLASNVEDGQMLLVNCTQAVTSLTISGNGATSVTGAPTTIAANGFFTLKYDKPSLTWYRVS